MFFNKWMVKQLWVVKHSYHEHSVQFSSGAQSCLILFDPMNRSMPGLPVHHQLPEFTETHVHRVSDAIQPPHPLSSPSPPAPNPSHSAIKSNALLIHVTTWMKLQGVNAKWKTKSITKVYILYDSIYIISLNWQNYRNKENRSMTDRNLGGEGRVGRKEMGVAIKRQ